MKTLTIRGVSEELHEKLKLRAKRNHRSLNQEIIAELSSNKGDEVILNKADYFIEMSNRLQKAIQKPLSRKEIDWAVKQDRR